MLPHVLVPLFCMEDQVVRQGRQGNLGDFMDDRRERGQVASGIGIHVIGAVRLEKIFFTFDEFLRQRRQAPAPLVSLGEDRFRSILIHLRIESILAAHILFLRPLAFPGKGGAVRGPLQCKLTRRNQGHDDELVQISAVLTGGGVKDIGHEGLSFVR